ncbi:hypothetical protein CABS01_09708 [Colletotrichum abscissum]|uniref:Uncharacterized protein n=1 Tax=Colletotrichum abscissum TaxID=1671311 RepID=A0A9P9XMG9_9PEZI|nr:uncharacterized protein CABS01_09708 [Colletotrichum abscissum]KAI3556780.1 hypothetical protein CABS02_02787 [Colletotrichum abscissum]KAK1500973.1 hypothetical protein CABS01_09708 [Colletotrichum abscissum]
MATLADYSVDPSTNPASWPTPHQTVEQANIREVNVDFIHTNTIGDSDFHNLRIGAEGHVPLLRQVNRHATRGLYQLISLNITEYSCVVLVSTVKTRNELSEEGFPRDNQDPQLEAAPESIPITTPVLYHVNLSTHSDPIRWPNETTGYIDISKVDIIYVNVNGDSDFHMLRTGTNEHVHHVVTQVTKHLVRGIYHLISLNATEHSCVVVISTRKKRSELP